MTLERITPPTKIFLTLPEVKSHLRITSDDEDAYVSQLSIGAEAHLDGYSGILGRALLTQIWEMRLPSFRHRRFNIPLPPLQSINSIKYLDLQGAEQLVSSSIYNVDTGGTSGGTVELKDGQVWPSIVTQRQDAVRVRFTCGYGERSDVPAPILSAALLIVGALYETRESSVIGKSVVDNPSVKMLINPYVLVGTHIDNADQT